MVLTNRVDWISIHLMDAPRAAATSICAIIIACTAFRPLFSGKAVFMGRANSASRTRGWVAWFIIAVVLGKFINIYGDGKQVRDLLYIDDLLDAYDAAIENKEKSQGQIFNIGGGMENSISIWQEFAPILEDIHGEKIPTKLHGWRPGDQKVYISDISRIKQALNWMPRHDVRTGIEKLYNWVLENKALFA